MSDSQDDLKQSLQDARDPPPKLVSAKGYLDRWIREHRGPHLGSGQPLQPSWESRVRGERGKEMGAGVRAGTGAPPQRALAGKPYIRKLLN